jgi:choline dehydrogenase
VALAGGPIPIRRHTASELAPWQAAFLEACGTLGFPRCDDSNDPTTTGAGPHAMNLVDGVRMSAARGYLDARARSRPNLVIRPGTVVRRVLLRDRRVVGVEVETYGRVHTIASSRVVLCAGATSTPGILLRSGIGPRRAVERLGVDVVVNLPAVGAKVLDHPGSAIFLRPKKPHRVPGRHFIQTVLRTTSKSGPRNDVFLQAGSVVPHPYGDIPLVSIMESIGKSYGRGTIEFTSPNPHREPAHRVAPLPGGPGPGARPRRDAARRGAGRDARDARHGDVLLAPGERREEPAIASRSGSGGSAIRATTRAAPSPWAPTTRATRRWPPTGEGA